jgi:hypothetical protein
VRRKASVAASAVFGSAGCPGTQDCSLPSSHWPGTMYDNEGVVDSDFRSAVSCERSTSELGQAALKDVK